MCIFGLLMSQSISQVALLPFQHLELVLILGQLGSWEQQHQVSSHTMFFNTFQTFDPILTSIFLTFILFHLHNFFGDFDPIHPGCRLERMLSVVRQRCQQIFKYTTDLKDEEEPGGPRGAQAERNDHSNIPETVRFSSIFSKSSKISPGFLPKIRSIQKNETPDSNCRLGF